MGIQAEKSSHVYIVREKGSSQTCSKFINQWSKRLPKVWGKYQEFFTHKKLYLKDKGHRYSEVCKNLQVYNHQGKKTPDYKIHRTGKKQFKKSKPFRNSRIMGNDYEMQIKYLNIVYIGIIKPSIRTLRCGFIFHNRSHMLSLINIHEARKKWLQSFNAFCNYPLF